MYNFSTAVDDLLMRITDVIRGQEHDANTARQLLIMEALMKVYHNKPSLSQRQSTDDLIGTFPTYSHCGLLVDQYNRTKLSKRSSGGTANLETYRYDGYEPDAILNYLATAGWSRRSTQDVFTISELTDKMRIEDINRNTVVFDERKLRWLNKQHLLRRDIAYCRKRLDGLINSAVAASHMKLPTHSNNIVQQNDDLSSRLSAAVGICWPTRGSHIATVKGSSHESLKQSLLAVLTQTKVACAGDGKERACGEELFMSDVTRLLHFVFRYPIMITLRRPRTRDVQALLEDGFIDVAHALLRCYDEMPSDSALCSKSWNQSMETRICQATGRSGKRLLPHLRLALTGRTSGPPLSECMTVLRYGEEVIDGSVSLSDRMFILRQIVSGSDV
eukprot:GHVQ01012514.1.p1 GENE.GHVQ01012514.1~~GHVQ01012514.1.p1  ORF type:complete len:389 (+),score=41.46 GHVQ01012514.1:164-1330(+)